MGDMTVEELKDKKLWFLWSAKPAKNGKVTKVPFSASGGATGTDDAHSGTWVSFDDAEEELKRMEEFRKAQAEVEKKNEKPMSQKMFKAI